MIITRKNKNKSKIKSISIVLLLKTTLAFFYYNSPLIYNNSSTILLIKWVRLHSCYAQVVCYALISSNNWVCEPWFVNDTLLIILSSKLCIQNNCLLQIFLFSHFIFLSSNIQPIFSSTFQTGGRLMNTIILRFIWSLSPLFFGHTQTMCSIRDNKSNIFERSKSNRPFCLVLCCYTPCLQDSLKIKLW